MFKNKLMAVFLREVAVNSLLVGVLPLFAAVVFRLFKDDLRLISQAAEWAPSPWMTGMTVVMLGLNASIIQRPGLSLAPGEEVVEMRRPSLKPPFARIAAGVLIFAAAGFWQWLGPAPYVHSLALLAVGACIYLLGVATYWRNTRTAYYVTNQRVVRMYRFISLVTTEIPIGNVNFISLSRSFFEILTGRGGVQVASGIGARRKVHMKEIDNPEPVAQAIQELVGWSK